VQVQEGMMFTFADLLKRQMTSILDLYGLTLTVAGRAPIAIGGTVASYIHGLVLQMMTRQLILNHMALPECTL
jgi:hypothetical protein